MQNFIFVDGKLKFRDLERLRNQDFFEGTYRGVVYSCIDSVLDKGIQLIEIIKVDISMGLFQFRGRYNFLDLLLGEFRGGCSYKVVNFRIEVSFYKC